MTARLIAAAEAMLQLVGEAHHSTSLNDRPVLVIYKTRAEIDPLAANLAAAIAEARGEPVADFTPAEGALL